MKNIFLDKPPTPEHIFSHFLAKALRFSYVVHSCAQHVLNKFTSNLLKRLFLTIERCQATLRRVQRYLHIARIYFWCSKESNRHLCILLSRFDHSTHNFKFTTMKNLKIFSFEYESCDFFTEISIFHHMSKIFYFHSNWQTIYEQLIFMKYNGTFQISK